MLYPALSYIVALAFLFGLSNGREESRPRGVSLEKASFYQGPEFRCLSNGKSFPIDHVNDDYCDCEDGSDEPGTAACNNGLFYCNNKPYKGSYIISSRVNDGICDCCDGSDEYDGTIVCENTCEKLFAEIKAQQEAFRKKQEEGYKVKLEYIQQGLRTKDEKRARLSELSKNKADLVAEKDRLQALRDEAEAPEKEAKALHEEHWKAMKEEHQRQKDAETATVAFRELDLNQDNVVDFPELMRHSEFDIDSDGTVSEDEAREYLEDNEQTDLNTFIEKIWPNIKEIYKQKEEQPAEGSTEEAKQPETDGDEDSANQAGKEIDRDAVREGRPDEEQDGDERNYEEDYDREEEYDEEEEDDDEEDYNEEKDDPDESYDLEKKKRRKSDSKDEEVPMPEYSEEVKQLIQVADEARRQFKEAEDHVRDVEREISDIEKYLELDFGPEEEFAALKGQCFEFTDREYTYKLCPFDKTSQKPKGGGIETNLGTWGHWHGPEEDKFDAMKYENGQGCWNGPNRSCHVNLHCGAENALTAASEPSRCEYQFDFTTPARCAKPEEVAPHYHVHTEL